MRRRKVLIAVSTAMVIALVALVSVIRMLSEKPEETILVHPDRKLGPFKDLRGVNGGPLSPRGWSQALTLNLSDYYSKLGTRVIRFHDVWRVDELDSIFPDPEADPADPASYNFSGLDRCVAEALKHAQLLILRIGFDWNDPPKSKPHVVTEKLAEISRRIVLHYTRGWANGHNYAGIWFEVWNEPDIEQFWALGEEEYFRMYESVARAIKEANPEAKVGGPAIAWNLGFLDRFLNYTRARGVPIDFVSWHIYSTRPEDIAARAREVRKIMEKHGYGFLPSVLDEWNYWDWQRQEPFEAFRTSKVAAFQAAALILLEDSPVDLATLYRGDAWTWGGLFYENGEPGKPFYVWLAYRELIEGNQRLQVEVRGRSLYAMASQASDGNLRLLVANYNARRVVYEIVAEGYSAYSVLAIDEENSLTPVEACRGNVCTIDPYAVQLVSLRKS